MTHPQPPHAAASERVSTTGGNAAASRGGRQDDSPEEAWRIHVWTNLIGLMVEPFALNEPNQLFLNTGSNVFTDVSATSGIQAGLHGITWAVATVDYDQDGDLDIITANDRGLLPPAQKGSVDRGHIGVLQNDSTGHRRHQFSADEPPRWLDGPLVRRSERGWQHWTSRWLLGQANGTFTDRGVPDLPDLQGGVREGHRPGTVAASERPQRLLF